MVVLPIYECIPTVHEFFKKEEKLKKKIKKLPRIHKGFEQKGQDLHRRTHANGPDN
jgi:hypothetical protein